MIQKNGRKLTITTIRRVYSVHPFQGEIRFRLTLRVILQLIRQRNDGDCTRLALCRFRNEFNIKYSVSYFSTI